MVIIKSRPTLNGFYYCFEFSTDTIPLISHICRDPLTPPASLCYTTQGKERHKHINNKITTRNRRLMKAFQYRLLYQSALKEGKRCKNLCCTLYNIIVHFRKIWQHKNYKNTINHTYLKVQVKQPVNYKYQSIIQLKKLYLKGNMLACNSTEIKFSLRLITRMFNVFWIEYLFLIFPFGEEII